MGAGGEVEKEKKRSECGGGSTFTVKKPDKHYLGHVAKVKSPVISRIDSTQYDVMRRTLDL